MYGAMYFFQEIVVRFKTLRFIQRLENTAHVPRIYV